jgi:hypothetical protein
MRRNYILEKLQKGEKVICYKESGNSMTPILKSRQGVDLEPISDSTALNIDDIVYCKINGGFYTHKITAIKEDQYQISNNHGHVNGWIHKDKIYGRVCKIY